MDLDDKVCLCFHVTRRKLQNFIRIEKPRRAAQLSECFGAGTGCGWCRPFLQRIFKSAGEESSAELDTDALPTAQEYARQRTRYVLDGQGTPPSGATPIEPGNSK